MKPGRQWAAWDVYFFDNNFTKALIARFGLAGPTVFLAFVLACKQAHIPGRIRYRTEDQALEIMGIEGGALIDNEGQPWTLDEFWELCGRHKQVRRSRRTTGWQQVASTRFTEWQQAANRLSAAERKRRSRGRNERDQSVTLEVELEREIYRGTSPGKTTPKPEPPAYPEWAGDDHPAEPIVDLKDALAEMPWRKNVDG